MSDKVSLITTPEQAADAVASARSTAARVLDPSKPYLWRCFRREVIGEGERSEVVWSECGEIAHRYDYSCPDPQAIGELSGAGEYMLIHDGRVTFMRIAQTEPRFEEVEDSE